MRKVPKKERFVVFDLLRGYFIFGIIVNHLALFPNVLAIFTGASKLWVSMAEGFFMVSGFFIGYLYKDKIKQDFFGVLKKLSFRSFGLYLWTVYLSLLFTYWGNLMPRGMVKESLWIVRWENIPELLTKALLFQYTYGWADILPLYSVFLLITPFYLWLLGRGYWLWLFLASILFWVFRGDSFYLAIQTIFFGGIILGFYSESIRAYWNRLGFTRQRSIRRLLYGVFVLTLFFSIFSVFFFDKVFSGSTYSEFLIHKNKVLNLYFDKQTVGVGRLLLSPIWILTGMFLFSKFDKVVVKYLGWLLFAFGNNSLYAYILHAFVIYPVPFLVYYFNFGGIWWNSLLTALAVTLVYALLKLSSEAFKKTF